MQKKKRQELNLVLIPAAGVEPARPQRALDFESSASANSATPADALCNAMSHLN